TAQIEVTYVTDPRTEPPTTVTHVITMAGEPTQSGLRCRILVNGQPVDVVKQVAIKQQGGTQKITLKKVVEKAVIGPAGCEDVLSFNDHAEAGGLSALYHSLAGNYDVTAKVKIGKRLIARKVNLSSLSCDFNDELVINF